MKLKLRKIGTSYGVIIPRKLITDEDFNAEEIDIEIARQPRMTATFAAMENKEELHKAMVMKTALEASKILVPDLPPVEVPEEVEAELEGELTYGSGKKKEDAKSRDPFRKLNKTKRKPISSRFEMCPKHKGSFKMTCGCK